MVKCPYCGFRGEEPYFFSLDMEDEGPVFQVDCEECGQEYTVTVKLTVEYEVSK